MRVPTGVNEPTLGVNPMDTFTLVPIADDAGVVALTKLNNLNVSRRSTWDCGVLLAWEPRAGCA